MNILGISEGFHDAAVCVLRNNRIIFASQAERFSGVKNDKWIHSDQLPKTQRYKPDVIAYYEKPFRKNLRRLYAGQKWQKVRMPYNECYGHHESHAAAGYYTSPFDDCNILVIDAIGEWDTMSIWKATTEKKHLGHTTHTLKKITSWKYPHSLGLLYSAFTYYAGFKVNSGEYKLMGLAPYGNPIYENKIINNLIDIKDDGTFRLDQSYFNYATGLTMTNDKFNELFGQKPRDPKTEQITQFHMDIASSIQKVTEVIMIKLAKEIRNEYGIKNLCLAGGVALNCVANGKILKEKIFENIWIQPAAGDAGGSLGAALALWYLEQDNDRKDHWHYCRP